MKCSSIFVFIMLFVLFEGCSNRKASIERIVIDEQSYDVPKTSIDKDTIVNPQLKNEQQSLTKSMYSNNSRKKEQDNMRGFDPASEDDLEDNGMSRYMENNDEEGWD